MPILNKFFSIPTKTNNMSYINNMCSVWKIFATKLFIYDTFKYNDINK